MSDAAFQGFRNETFGFLSDLSANNSKDWFESHRADYDKHWKSASLDLITALVKPMTALSPRLKAEARLNGSLRRINRDVRFSKDKTPYDPRLHLVFWTGDHPNRSAGFHFVIYADGIGYGAGQFGLDAKALKSYRQRILNPVERADLLAAIERAASVGCDMDGPDQNRLPSGFQADGDWEHLLRRRSFIARTQGRPAVPAWLQGPDCVKEIVGIADELMPFIRWLNP